MQVGCRYNQIDEEMERVVERALTMGVRLDEYDHQEVCASRTNRSTCLLTFITAHAWFFGLTDLCVAAWQPYSSGCHAKHGVSGADSASSLADEAGNIFLELDRLV